MADTAWDGLPDYQEAKIYVSRQPSWFRRHLIHILYASLVVISNFVSVEIVSNLYGRGFIHKLAISTRPALTKAIFYSDIDSSYHEEIFSGFLMNGTEYTAPPSPEVDAAWRELGVTYEVFLIPEELGQEFQASSQDIVMEGEIPGHGWGSGYPANIEALHQLHCVDLLRKAVFFNHDYYSSRASTFTEEDTRRPGFFHEPAAAFLDGPEGLRAHINHCVDALRERIMCAADTGVTLYHWDDAMGRLTSDFARPRQCKNFDSVRKFAERRQLDLGGSFNYTTY